MKLPPFEPLKRKMRKRSGYVLFKDRMRREGRWKEYKELVRKYLVNGIPSTRASYNACVEMGYKGPKDEHRINNDFMAHGADWLRKAALQKEMETVDETKEALDLRDRLGEFDIDASELPAEIAFVFHNLHKAKGEEDKWLVAPDEAPSPGAWNMLVWAAENQTKFFELVIREQLKKNDRTDELGMGDTGESVSQIDKILNELTDG